MYKDQELEQKLNCQSKIDSNNQRVFGFTKNTFVKILTHQFQKVIHKNAAARTKSRLSAAIKLSNSQLIKFFFQNSDHNS